MGEYSAKQLNKIAKIHNSIPDHFYIKDIENQAKVMAERGKFELKYTFSAQPFDIEDIENYFISEGFKVKVEIEINDEYYYLTLILNWDLQ